MFARCGIILLMEVEVSIHVELDSLQDLHVEITSMFNHFVVLDSDIDVR